jgi:hypothetical protein
MQLRSKELGEQLIALNAVRTIARQHEVDLKAEHRACSSGHAAMVRLCGTNGDERASTMGDRISTQELEFAHLVTTSPKAGEVVAFDP